MAKTRAQIRGAEAPPLANSTLRKKIKYRIVWSFLCLGDLKFRDLTNLGHKIDFDTVKLQRVTYDIIFMTTKRLCHQKYFIKMT